MRYGPATDAPTHLGSNALALPPEWLVSECDEGEPATAARGSGPAPTHLQPMPRLQPTSGSIVQPAPTRRSPTSGSIVQPAPTRLQPTHHSVVQSARVRQPAPTTLSRHSSVAKPVPVRARTERDDDDAQPLPAAPRSRGSSKSIVAPREQRSKSATPSSAAPTPQAPAPQRAQSSPQIPVGINAIDPLAVPVPPELAAPIFSWVRRLALQADLTGADRVLRDALADLTSSLSVSIVYPGQDGLWSLGADDEIPRDAQPIIAVATARRAIVSSHTAIIPVVTTSETVAVLVLTRNPRNPGYHPIEQIAMISLARESAAILHHLAVLHLQRASEIKADKGGLYRGEALEAHRTRGNEGVPVHLTPGWVRRTYPVLVATLLIAIAVAIFITVPTYSTGSGIVIYQGTPVTAPAAGTVEQILVQQGDSVKKGQILIRLHSANEEAELALASTDWNNATIQYLFDQTDEQIKKALASAAARVERARAQVDTRVVRARKDGTVSDRRVQMGQLLQPGDHILTIVEPGAEPEVIAFLPGKDRPRLRKGMTLQVELGGYTKIRELAIITSVGNENIGGNEAARYLGAQLADSLKLQGGSFVIVKARLPTRTFKTEHRTFRYYHGMLAQTEVKIQSKPFLVTLLPALEKYLPD